MQTEYNNIVLGYCILPNGKSIVKLNKDNGLDCGTNVKRPGLLTWELFC